MSAFESKPCSVDNDSSPMLSSTSVLVYVNSLSAFKSNFWLVVAWSAFNDIWFDTVVAKLASSFKAAASSFNVFSVSGAESTKLLIAVAILILTPSLVS